MTNGHDERAVTAATDHALVADPRRIAQMTAVAGDLPSWTLTEVQRTDLELLVTGAYHPLTGFLTSTEVASVVASGRLPSGEPWPVPVTLAVDRVTHEAGAAGGRLSLRDDEHTLLALLTVTDAWTVGDTHLLGGAVEGLRLPARWDFADLRRPFPALRAELAALPADRILVAQPAGPVDRRTALRWGRAAWTLQAGLVLLPPVGADPEPVHVHRVRAYRHLLAHLPEGTLLRLLPSGRPPADPQAAALHALVAARAGATHLLLPEWREGDTSAGPDPGGIEAMGLFPVDPAGFGAEGDPPPGDRHPEVAAELAAADPPRSRRGLVVLLTGLSGSGKSTIAKVLRARLTEAGDRRVTLLDGDLVRRMLSSELGFSREHRDLNVRRIGYVASEIAKHGGIAICAPIAPYDATRRQVRGMVEGAGAGFVLVHVATPIEVCEARDVKGLYARARAGELTGFTGVDDPYEPPLDAEVTIDTTDRSPEACAAAIVARITEQGWYDPAR